MIVKVCGMRDGGNIRDVESLGADWMGFIFFPRSPRYVSEPPACLPTAMKRIGVFVNASDEDIMRRVGEYSLYGVQLHGSEPPEQCLRLRRSGVMVMKAFDIGSPSDLSATVPYDGAADFFLFDTPCPGFGGSGRCFDWSLLARYQGDTPFLLSGGISLATAEALRTFSHPAFAGIDVNSGFETAPAMKDVRSLAEFLRKIGKGGFRQPYNNL